MTKEKRTIETDTQTHVRCYRHRQVDRQRHETDRQTERNEPDRPGIDGQT